ncbi:MAG: hypothetical protein P4M07_17260 [Xanthobacteraceae bacterium]|nr:hypothetical protein [Xanthobacteraceae bacterium]
MNRGAGVIAIAGLLVAGTAAGAAEPADAVKLVKEVWKKPGRNNIGVADLTISNGNPFAVKDVKIKCVFTAAATGKVTELQQSIPGPVKAMAEQTFRKVSFGFIDTRAEQGACQVLAATRI